MTSKISEVAIINRANSAGKNARWFWVGAAFLAAIVWFGLLFYTPRLTLSYNADQLSTNIAQGKTRGFYKSEIDANGNRYSWTAEKATLTFDFEGRKPLEVRFSARGAAIAGGPTGPVRVLANEREIGQFTPDPTNADFQTFKLRFTPNSTPDQKLRLEIVATPFNPKGDPRTLGTMIQTITVDKSEAWGSLSSRSWLFYLWAVLIIIAAGLKFILAPALEQNWLKLGGTLSAGLAVAVAALLSWLFWNLGILERETSRSATAGAFYLLLFSGGLALYGWINFSRGFAKLLKPKTHPLEISRLAKIGLGGLGFGLTSALAIYVQLNFDNTLYWLDLNIYLEAGRKVSQVQNAYQPFIIGTSFFYPPPALLLFAPLGQLSPNVAHGLWFGFSGLCYGLSLGLLWQTFRFSGWLTIPALFFLPLWETLSVGQINNVVLLGLSLLCWSYRPAKSAAESWLGNTGAALATMLKMTPALLLLPWPILRDWARLGRTALGLTVLAILPVLLWGLKPWLDFLQVLPNLFTTGSSSRSYSLAPTLDWLLTGLHDGEQSATAILFSRLAAVGLIGGWLWFGLNFYKTAPQAVLAAGVVTLTISSSIVWYHHFVFLLIPICYLLGTGRPAAYLAGVLSFGLIQVERGLQRLVSLPPVLSGSACLLLFSVLIFLTIKNRHLIQIQTRTGGFENAIPK